MDTVPMSLHCFIPFRHNRSNPIGQLLRNEVFRLDSRVPDSLAETLGRRERQSGVAAR